MKRSHWLVVIGLAGLALRAEAQPPGEPTPATASYQMLDWEALLPPTERNQAAEPPAPVHDYLGEGGMAALQAGSSKTNSKLNQLRVKIPGFIVPLDNRPDGRVQEFFLVPYFGACIHVPPPPPNQIVYVKAPSPVKLGSMYDAVWVSGTLRTDSRSSQFGDAAYSLDAVKVEPYQN